jgi:hypothetical protein
MCEENLCKGCAEFLDNATFSFMKKIPEELTHTYYCMSCYNTHIVPALESYNEVMERAKRLYVFFDTRRNPVQYIKKAKEEVRVDDCEDRDETILRLAFLAAQVGYNAVIEAAVVSEKIRNGGHQKSRWKGTAIPAMVDAEKLERFSDY